MTLKPARCCRCGTNSPVASLITLRQEDHGHGTDCGIAFYGLGGDERDATFVCDDGDDCRRRQRHRVGHVPGRPVSEPVARMSQ